MLWTFSQPVPVSSVFLVGRKNGKTVNFSRLYRDFAAHFRELFCPKSSLCSHEYETAAKRLGFVFFLSQAELWDISRTRWRQLWLVCLKHKIK